MYGHALQAAVLLAIWAVACERGGQTPSYESAEITLQAATATPPAATRHETVFRDVASTPVPTLAVPPTPLESGDRAVARVGGRFIMLSEVLRGTAERELSLGAGPAAATEAARLELRQQVLDGLIEDKLTEWEAELGEVQLSPEEEEAGVARIIDGMGGYQRMLELAAAVRMSEEEMRRRMLTRLKVSRLFQRNVLDRLDLSEEKLREYYNANRTTKFRVPGCVYLRRVLIKSGEKGRDDAAARAEAEMLRAQAEAALAVVDASYAAALEHAAGTDEQRRLLAEKRRERMNVIKELALAHSDGPARQQGGNIALYDVLLDGSHEMVFDIKFVEHVYEHGEPDVLSPVVAAEGGYLFYLVEQRLPSQQKEFEESRDLIERILVKEQREQLYREWISRLNQRAGVETYPEHLKFVDENLLRDAAAIGRDARQLMIRSAPALQAPAAAGQQP